MLLYLITVPFILSHRNIRQNDVFSEVLSLDVFSEVLNSWRVRHSNSSIILYNCILDSQWGSWKICRAETSQLEIRVSISQLWWLSNESNLKWVLFESSSPSDIKYIYISLLTIIPFIMFQTNQCSGVHMELCNSNHNNSWFHQVLLSVFFSLAHL